MNTRIKIFLGAIILTGFSACAVIQPRALNPGWKWDGVPRVMPNSIFEPVARARSADAQPVPAMAVPKAGLRDEMSLDGAWRYLPDPSEKGEAEKWFAPELNDSSWKTMKVPSNFVLEDNSLSTFYKPVWFRRTFDAPGSFAGKNLRLNFEGVDYFAKVWLNGELLGEHEGYFNPFNFDVTAKFKPGMNVLVVKVTNPWDYSMKRSEITNTSAAEKIWIKSVLNFHDSRMGGALNSAYASQSWGTGGIYRPVKIVATGDVAIDWILISPKLSENYTKAEVAFDVFLTNFTGKPLDAIIRIDALGENFRGYQDALSAKALLQPGPNKVRLLLKVDTPKLWWPYSHPELGTPNLYRMNAAVILNDKTSDQDSEIFGIKEVKLTETGPEAFFWFVNGKRMSFRGTNGIPTEYYSKLTPEYLADYFRVLKENNMDILIIHDHQAPPMVYDQADQEGMVVLQNFTLIWGFSPCDFERPDGDPALTSNEQVIARMAVEAMWYLYNHPSIFWWSMHDESFHIEFGEKQLLPGNFCPKKPFKEGDKISQFNDATLNLNIDNQLTKIARALNQTIPIHRTGGKITDSTTYYGWYSGTYWGLIKDPEAFPLEFGSESVPYAMAAAMTYFKDWFPISSEKSVSEWEYHGLQFPIEQAYIGRTEAYDNFNDWAFSSQLYQAVVNKYHIEINRENKYHPTGSVLQWMYNEWWPSVNFGIADWNLEPRLALDWVKRAFSPQLVATRVDRNIYSQGDKIEIPVHLMNDEYNEFRAAKVVWRLVEETDGFFIRGNTKAKPLISSEEKAGVSRQIANLIENTMRTVPEQDPVTATIGHRVPIAEAAKGEFKVDFPADSHVIAGFVKFDAPKTKEPKHYTIYMTLASAEGKILCENWDHFVVVENAGKFKVAEGIWPQPRFKLELRLSKGGKALAGSEVLIVDKYNPDSKHQVKLDASASATVEGMIPGAYRMSVDGNSYEFLLNQDEKLEVNFVPGMKTTLGVRPIIDWKKMQRPEQVNAAH